MTGDLLITNARGADGELSDIRARAGVIVAMGAGPAGEPAAFDAGGQLVLPGLVNGHVHLDKSLLGFPWVPHRARTSVRQRIAFEREHRGNLPPVADRASALLARATSHGTALLRSHVDIDPDIGLANLEGVLEACARHADAIDVQLVAFPQSGILASPGTEQLLADAVRLGAGFVGGLDPAGFDGDAVRHLDIVFGLAERTGAGVDIHLHDGGGLGVHELELIAERTAALGMAGRVAVSHAYCLGEVDDPVLGATADRLAAAGVAIFTSAPGAAPMPPVKRLISAGVQVFAGSDNIRDLWAPYGTGDPLEVAMMVGYRSDFRTDEDLALALSMVTDRAAAALGVSPWGIADGAPAHLVALPVRTVGEAVVERPPRSAVIRHGVVIREGGR